MAESLGAPQTLFRGETSGGWHREISAVLRLGTNNSLDKDKNSRIKPIKPIIVSIYYMLTIMGLIGFILEFLSLSKELKASCNS